ncbi:hypothetical protein [Actinoplanes sp. NBRC 101535]|uniref:hypothetical protein n=1 Tax=Actinoplanes sp. NBRC 101535 TaxID=3032196 RepID=UPI002552355A|nr:hypothetical protein [Actinoplanes sp. NBRC 101535]
MRRFEGWEPATICAVTAWDEAGRPAAWTMRPEPEWDGRERSLMLALDMWEAGLCRRCGEHLEQSADPDTDPDDPRSSQAWRAEDPTECFSCKVLARSERRAAPRGDDDEDASPWLIHTTQLVPKTPRAPGRRRPP